MNQEINYSAFSHPYRSVSIGQKNLRINGQKSAQLKYLFMMLLPMNISCKFVSHSPPQIVIICLRQKSNRQVHRKLRCIYILICAYDFTWIMGKHIACVGYIFTYWVILMISSIFLNSEMVITRITKFDLIFSLWHFFCFFM